MDAHTRSGFGDVVRETLKRSRSHNYNFLIFQNALQGMSVPDIRFFKSEARIIPGELAKEGFLVSANYRHAEGYGTFQQTIHDDAPKRSGATDDNDGYFQDASLGLS